MVNENIFTLWPQILTELIVFLGRPSVQLQLMVVVVALVVAAVCGRIVQRRWRARFQANTAEAGFGFKLLYYLFLQLSTGVLVLLLIEGAQLILAASGARTALIDSLVQIVIVFLILKGGLAVAIALGDLGGIQSYHKTLIVPLLLTVVVVQLVAVFFSSERLSNAPVFSLFDNTITLSALFLITAGFYLWLVGVNAVGQGVQYVATEYAGAEAGSTQATLTLLRYILIMVGLVYVLFRLNFNTTTIAAISGGLSVGVGFALSTILSNFVSGILLLFERTLHPGDIIEYNGILCTVQMITIRSIRVRTFDNIEMVIPNSEFVSAPFTTYTGKSKHVRLKIPIGTSYDDNYQLVIDTLMELALNHPQIMDVPPPDVRIEGFGDFTIDYQMYVWVPNPLVSAIVKNELHKAILDAFEEKGITIPYPIQVEIQPDEV
ncbi:MAG: mechanosensitive ion channel [Anaerolineales bacterium]|nr:mechanosensitive ion channel [Anaerolineales bacterium]